MKPASSEQVAQSSEYNLPYHYFVSYDPKNANFRSFKSLMFALSYALGNTIVYRAIKDSQADSWCDVGCGDGALISSLQSYLPGVKCVGFDYDEKAIMLANHINPGVLFRTADITSDHLGRYGIVTAVEVLEHIPPNEFSQFVQSLGALVAPGGCLVITVPHVNQGMAAKHYRHFKIKEIANLIVADLSDFEISEAFGFGHRNWLERLNKALFQTKHVFLEIAGLNRFRMKLQLKSLPLTDDKAQQVFVRFTKRA